MNTVIIIVAVIVAVIVLSIAFIKVSGNIVNYFMVKEEYNKMMLASDIYSKMDNIEEILDKFIMSEFERYKVFNIDKFQEEYLTDKVLDDMVLDVYDLVINTMSSTLYNTVSLIYNKRVLPSIIKNKVVMIIMNEGVQHNSVIDGESKYGSENVNTILDDFGDSYVDLN